MVEWRSLVVECPVSIPADMKDQFADLLLRRKTALQSLFLSMIYRGMFPSAGWTVEERISLENGMFLYTALPKEPASTGA